MNRDALSAAGIAGGIGLAVWYVIGSYLPGAVAVGGGLVAGAISLFIYVQFTPRGLQVFTVLALLGAAVQGSLNFKLHIPGYEVGVQIGSASPLVSVTFAVLAVVVLLVMLRSWDHPAPSIREHLPLKPRAESPLEPLKQAPALVALRDTTTDEAETVLYEFFSKLNDRKWRKGIEQRELIEAISREFGAERANGIISDFMANGLISRAEGARFKFLTKFTDQVHLRTNRVG